MDYSGPSGQPDTNWTVFSPNAMRGNLTGDNDPADPRKTLGWKSSLHTTQKLENVGKWMSTTLAHQQPLMYDGGFDSGNDQISGQQSRDLAPASSSSYPHPTLSLPHPSLTLDFRLSATLNPRISVGPTPFGHRNWISLTGGSWSGSWGSGIVLPGGQDSQIVIADNSAHLEANYILQTYDNPPAHIVVKAHGWRTGPPEVLAQIADPKLADSVDPRRYKFRLFIEMETGDERYRDVVNCGMWVGSGMRKGSEVIYDAYRVA